MVFNRLKSFIFRSIIKLFFIVAEYIVLKDKNLIVFGGPQGDRYADNCKYLFEYLLSKQEFNCYWISQNINLLNSVDEKLRDRLLLPNSIQSLWLFLKASTVIIAYSRTDVAPYYLSSKRKNVINLWHGIPLKNIGFLDAKIIHNEKRIRYLDKERKNYSYFVTSSEIESYIQATAFRLSYDQIWLTGLPRNDGLAKNINKNVRELITPDKQAKLVLYAPTFRDGNRTTEFFPFADKDLYVLATFLNKHNIYLLIRAHSNERNKLAEMIELHDELKDRLIFVGQDRFADVNDLLPAVDILITDYSGIFFDFLLLERPIIFIPYDYEEYVRDRGGFVLDYFKYTPGDKVYTQHDLLLSLEKYLLEPEKDSERRKMVCDLFHHYQDGMACERIYQKICEINNH